MRCSYVEYCKPQLKVDASDMAEKAHVLSVLKFVLLSSISQLHPFMPFETEEINSILSPSFVPLLHQNYFTPSNPLRVQRVNKSLISEVEVILLLLLHRRVTSILSMTCDRSRNSSAICGRTRTRRVSVICFSVPTHRSLLHRWLIWFTDSPDSTSRC